MRQSSQENIPHCDEQGSPARHWRFSRRWWALRMLLLLGMAPVVMAIVASVILIGHEVRAPSWVVNKVEARAAEVLQGGSLNFGEMRLTIGSDLHPRFVLQNAVLTDPEGALLANVPRIEGQLSPRGILKGRFLPQEVTLTGAELYLNRASDGSLAFAFSQGGTGVAAQSIAELIEQIDAVFQTGPLEALEQVHAQGVILNYTDARAGRSWVVDDGRITLDLRGAELALRADLALLSGRSYITQAEFSYRSPHGDASAEVGVTITDAAGADIASQSPVLSWLGVLDAPISGALRGVLDDQGALASASATLQIGAGELRPTAQTRPIPFQAARTYLTYDPAADRLSFDLIEVQSALGLVRGTMQTYLRDYAGRWPNALVGQARFSEIEVAPGDWYDTPVTLRNPQVDFRLRLDPFGFEIGQASLSVGDLPLHLDGEIIAASAGWSVALDGTAQEVVVGDVLSLWPGSVTPNLRGWLDRNVLAGRLQDAFFAFRAEPEQPPVIGLTAGFDDARVRVLQGLPPIEAGQGTLSILGRRVVLSLDRGHMTAPQAGQIALGGSSMVIPQTGHRAPARFDLTLDGATTAIASVLALPPFNQFQSPGLPPDFAQGRARVALALDTPLGRNIPPEDRDWSATATLRDLRSTLLVPNRTLTARALDLRVTPRALLVEGPVQLDGIAAQTQFSRALGPGSEGSARLEATLSLNAESLQAFNISLPDGMLRGDAPARLALDLSTPSTPRFRLTSDLRGAVLSLAGLGWSKARVDAAGLVVTGQLGATPRVEELSLDAPGLRATGSVRLRPGGGLDSAAFSRVRLGGWLDAPVTLTGRGPGQAAAVAITGGTLDLRRAPFGPSTGGSAGAAPPSAGGPLELALDRLQITDTIALTGFRGALTMAGGLQGEFRGQLNGQSPVQGMLVPVNGRVGLRVTTTDAGAALRAAGLMRNAVGGQMQLALTPTGGAGSFDGQLRATGLRVRDVPTLAALLDAISVVGLLGQLDGQGLIFDAVDARFRVTPGQIILAESSAVGPSLGVSLDGMFNKAAGQMDFQGVISPFYLVNGIGAGLTRAGEGLFGFNFNLRGSVDNPQVSVNPLSVLTPGMFREIFRRSPPDLGQ